MSTEIKETQVEQGPSDPYGYYQRNSPADLRITALQLAIGSVDESSNGVEAVIERAKLYYAFVSGEEPASEAPKYFA